MMEPPLPTSSEGRELLEIALQKSGQEVSEVVAAVQYAAQRAVIWAVISAFFATVLGLASLAVLVSVMQSNNVSALVAIPVTILSTLVALYIMLLFTWNSARLCGRVHFGSFRLIPQLRLPGNGWVAYDDMYVHIWTYRIWWPLLMHYATLDRRACAWQIGTIVAMPKGCVFEVVSAEGKLVRLRGGPKSDVVRISEMLRADAGTFDAGTLDA